MNESTKETGLVEFFLIDFYWLDDHNKGLLFHCLVIIVTFASHDHTYLKPKASRILNSFFMEE